jgi:aspartyl/asparaginyl-tRNA synthetase
MALNRSEGDPEARFTIKYVAVKDINASMAGQMIRVRGRCHSVKSQKQAVFIVMRESFDTIQTIVFKPDTSAGMH